MIEMTKLKLRRSAFVVFVLSIFAIMQNDMVVEYANEAPKTATAASASAVTEPTTQAPVTKATSSDQVENDLSPLKIQTADNGAPEPPSPQPVVVSGEEKTADDTIFATITIQVPAAVAEEKIEPKQADASSSLVIDSNRTEESSTPTPFVVVNKADMQSFEEWKEMRLKDAAQLKDKQQQQQQQASQSINNVSSQQASAAASASGTTTSSQPGQNGQAKPDKGAHEPSSTATKKPNGELNNGADSSGLLHRRKNYASADCGAKIIASNPEANNPSHVLSESKDDYMLNSCKSNIWFVVELCEPVKINEVEIANLELFSNVPRQFNVYASERFPQTSNGKEWQNKYWLGTFEAANTRSIQHFAIHSDKNTQGDSTQGQDKETGSAGSSASSQQQQQLPNVIMFSKYVRFEMVSHYGTEHYCPLSLVRIYGTSMADEEEVMQTNEIDEDVHAHHHLTLNTESIKAPSTAGVESTDGIKILINENDLKADPVTAQKAPESQPIPPVAAPVDDKKPPTKKFLGSLQNSLINSIISIFPSENFNITKLFGSLTGNRNYFGRRDSVQSASVVDSNAKTTGADPNVVSKANNMGKPTKSTIIMENQTNDASNRHSAANRNNTPRTPIPIEPSKDGAFMPVVLTNYMFKNKEERDRAVTLQIDLHKLLCSSNRFGSSAIHLDLDSIDCCQCWTGSTNASIQRSRAGLMTKYCSYYFLMMTSAQSRSQNSLLSKYIKNTHLSLPQSSAALGDDNGDEWSSSSSLFTHISINNINYYILNELLDNRTTVGPNDLSPPLTWPSTTEIKTPKAEDRPVKTLEPSTATPSSPQADGLNLSEKNESANSEDEEKVRYTILTTNESDLLDRDPSKGTDASMGKFNLESGRNRHQQQQAIKDTTAPASSNSSQESEPSKVPDAAESADKESQASIDGNVSAEPSDLESVLKTEEMSEPSSQDAEKAQQQQQQAQQPTQNGAGANQAPRPTQPIVIGNGKEALIMRLSNRIKMLELNMTLSSQYLEKLSQHYK